MKIKFNRQKQKWIELPPHSKEGFYLDPRLRYKLDIVKKILKNEWDAPLLIDGYERSGKSTLAMTMGWYLSNETLSINNFCYGLDDAIKKIKEIPDKSILIVDEGSLVFSSKDVMMKEQKKLMKILDVVGMKNLIIIICLPSFFDLNKSIAIRRSRFLLHVYKSKEWERGRFCYFSERGKRTLYTIGKKGFGSYSKPKANFFGRFTKFQPPFYQEYLKFKRKTLLETLNDGAEFNKHDIKTELIYNFKKNQPEVTDKIIAKGFGISLSEYYRRKKRWEILHTTPPQPH